ncbi:MAG TPA: vitamin K epoxide reductase family protein [Candidatus Nanoarchaeia archaeon]|nr:vitamin K epoxide reductase family protein [Candidatus Nanoarchaeia archaeon]
MFEEALLIVFSVLGFLTSYHIWNISVRKKEKLICAIGDGNCDKVVKSKYSKIFGIDNSILGMLYYIFIFSVGILMIIFPLLFVLSYAKYGMLIITGGSMLFSAILFFIEIKVIKSVCEYCTISAIISVLIFAVIIFKFFF